jgi:cytosine/uracil/thiamine/allantoin permease
MLVYFMDTWSILRSLSYILWTFGIVHGNLVDFSRFAIFYQEKILQHCSLPFSLAVM